MKATVILIPLRPVWRLLTNGPFGFRRSLPGVLMFAGWTLVCLALLNSR